MYQATARLEPTLGILGGMGPFASAAFLMTVYEAANRQLAPTTEQLMPRCVLDSDPAFPDRTEAIRAGHDRQFAERLGDRIGALLRHGASRVVITCVTAHHFVHRLDREQRAKLISLVETALDDLEVAGEGRFLMMATNGTREARVFEYATRWPEVARRVVLPPPAAQTAIHHLLYRLKREPVSPELVGEVEELALRHGCRGVIAGCTELHLITRWRRANPGGFDLIDPLESIATDLKMLLELRKVDESEQR